MPCSGGGSSGRGRLMARLGDCRNDTCRQVCRDRQSCGGLLSRWLEPLLPLGAPATQKLSSHGRAARASMCLMLQPCATSIEQNSVMMLGQVLKTLRAP